MRKIFSSKLSLRYILMNKRHEILERYDLNVRKFIPEFYRLDLMADLKAFIESKTQGYWIKRPISNYFTH